MSRIIYVGGVHGVGKTFFSEKLCVATPLNHVIASVLIGTHKATTKRVQNVDKNQDILLQAMKENLEASKDYLLDGHFCLLNSDGEITKIKMSVFQEMGLAGIFILQAEISVIKERLKGKDSEKYPLDLLKKFQETEISYGKQVAGELEIPFQVVSSLDLDMDKSVQFVQKLLK